MARARGARAQMALAFEATYGVAPASGFIKIPFAPGTGLGMEQPLLENELLGFGRDPVAPTLDVITAGGDVTVPIDLENWGLWLRAAFGAPVTTGAAAPYTHVFESGAWTLPSLAIETGLPDVPNYGMAVGCMVDTLSWTMQRSGNLTAKVGLRAQGEEAPTSTSNAGTPTEKSLIRLGNFNGSILRNGTQLANIVSGEVMYSNNLDPIETIRSDGKIDGLDPAMAACRGSITVRFADRVLLDQAVSGASCALDFTLEKSASEKFTFSVPRVFLPRPRITIDGPNGIEVKFDWQASQQADGSPMVVATLINAVDAY